MHTPLQLTNDDIRLLKDQQLVQLLWQLVDIELGVHGIQKYDSQVPLSIYIKDGGIDGLAKWDDGPNGTTYFPSRDVGFQAKATDMTDADCAGEVRRKDGTLKPQVAALVERGGTYVLFLGRDCVSQSKGPRIAAMKAALAEGAKSGGLTVTDPDVRIYDATEIAGWANAYPASVATVLQFLGRSGAGVLTWDELSGYPAFAIAFAEKDAKRDTVIEALREAARTTRSVARVIGRSGLGKTRLVFEAFRPPPDRVLSPAQALLNSSFCYLSAAKTENIHSILLDWRRRGCTGTIVVDDCTLELHEELAQEVLRADSRLGLITLGNDLSPTAYAGTPSKLMIVEAADEALIEDLLKAGFPTVSEEDRRFIAAELTQGYPLMAIRVGEARVGQAPLAARLTKDVLAKLLGRPVEPGSTAEKVISACALFEYLGLTDEVASEREFVRQNFCPSVSADDFYAEVIEFEKSGAIARYGRLVQVRPPPLAIRLAADWWERCLPEFAAGIVERDFPEALATAFCERLRMLDFVPAIRETSEKLCGPRGPFGQAKVLNSDLGSLLFRAIVEVNPSAAMSALSYAFNSDLEALSKVEGEARRNLVLALEKLAFREETFASAAETLAVLGAVENERWSNNATGVFSRLFMVLLPGTQTPLLDRLRILKNLARHSDARVRDTIVSALDSALTTDNFVGTLGGGNQGSGSPLKEYRPRVWKEVFDYWSECLSELVRFIEDDEAHGEKCRDVLGSHFRGLIRQGRLDDLEWVIERVTKVRPLAWPQAIEGIKDALKYDSDLLPAEAIGRLRAWVDQLTPDDVQQRLKLFVTEAPFDHEEDDTGEFVDMAARNAVAYGKECGGNWANVLPFFSDALQGQQRQAYSFGAGLAQGSSRSSELFEALLQQLADIPFEKRNSGLLSGWLAEVDTDDSASADAVLSSLAANTRLLASLPAIIRGLKLSDPRIALVETLFREGHIDHQQLLGMSYGQAMAAVSVARVMSLCRLLVASGVEGAWVALDIAFMYAYSDVAKSAELSELFTEILRVPGMLSSEHGRRDAHTFEVIAKRLVSSSPELAENLVRELLTIVQDGRGADRQAVESLLSMLLEKQTESVWPLVRDAISNSSGRGRWRILTNLQGGLRDDSVGPISFVSLDLLRAWCNSSPTLAPALVASFIRVLVIDANGGRLSEGASMLLDNFGDQEAVLNELSANLHTFSWAGSAAPFYERVIEALTPLLHHAQPEVRRWSERQVEDAKVQRRQALQEDEERRLGRF